jgi:hypothetical protein
MLSTLVVAAALGLPSGAAGPAGGCGSLPSPDGKVVRVGPNQAGDLPRIVADAGRGTTILLEDGIYTMGPGDEADRRIQFRTPNVTLRSASNDADGVVIDGEYLTNEIVMIHASNVTIGHLTITRAVDHPVHISPWPTGNAISGTRLYDLRIIDGGEQFVKVNPNGDPLVYADNGRVECSLFRMTDEGRTHVEHNFGGCYTGGIDAHGARGWKVRQNRFEGIYCAGEGLAEHAVHFWKGARGTLVENNIIINCARGIGLGLGENDGGRTYPDKAAAGYVGHFGGLIRNNVVYADVPYFDTGIELSQARGAKVYHNTIPHSPSVAGFFSSIDLRFANTSATIRNNLVEAITVRDGAAGKVNHNLQKTPLELFMNPGGTTSTSPAVPRRPSTTASRSRGPAGTSTAGDTATAAPIWGPTSSRRASFWEGSAGGSGPAPGAKPAGPHTETSHEIGLTLL